MKRLVKKYFSNITYYYQYLGWRMVPLLGISIFVGLLDGLGLAMFIPLLEIASGEGKNASTESLGNLKVLLDAIQYLGLSLTLKTVLLIMLIFFVFKGAAVFLSNYIYAVYSQLFIRAIRVENIDALSTYSYNAFVTADAGAIQNTLSGEVQKVAINFQMFVAIFRQSLMLLTYTILAFWANPEFSILVVLGGLFSHFIFSRLYRKTKELSKQLVRSNHGFQGLLIQEVAFFKYLKATARIKNYSINLKSKVYELEDQMKQVGILNAIMQGSREPIIVGIVVLIILVQVQILGGKLSTIMLALLFFYRGLSSLMTLLNSYNSYLSTYGSLQNMQDFTKELNRNSDVNGNQSTPTFDKGISIKNVSFSYRASDLILNDITISIKPLETLAIIGESGSGKTTFMNILSGLLRPTHGRISINGIEYKNLDINALQQKIGYITQEPVIFDDTVYNNVTFWSNKSEVNMVRFHKALEQANILELIDGLEKKEDSRLGNNGISLSGGQKQRISIARELYKEVNFLFMDEATSALDSETERAIQENIDLLRGQYTILIIAHRLSTIKNADRVMVLKHGRIEHIGTYEELIEQSDSFKRMVELQEL